MNYPRPPVEINDPYPHARSCPTTPYGMPPRMNGGPPPMADPVGQHGECFGDGPFANGFGPRSPYPPFPSLSEEDGHVPFSHHGREDSVRRTNLMVQFVNGQITHTARFAQLQPKMCDNGSYPQDFRIAKTVDEFRVLDCSTLDRILQAYKLPTSVRAMGLQFTSRELHEAKTVLHAKLCTLFDYLGAFRIAERIRESRRHSVLALS